MDGHNMNKHKQFSEIMKQITWLGQLGLSLIMPLLLCMLGCAFLCDRFNIGGWIYIIGFILGLGSGFMTAFKFYKSESDKASSESKKVNGGYNRHI